ncbi:hypothetical protein MHYP_G00304250 [Metynnis hypsauchen]
MISSFEEQQERRTEEPERSALCRRSTLGLYKAKNGEISVFGGSFAGEERGERSGRSGHDSARGTCAHIWPRLRVSDGQCRSCVLSADGRTMLSKSLDRNKQAASSRTHSWSLFRGRTTLGSYLCRLFPSICFPSGP